MTAPEELSIPLHSDRGRETAATLALLDHAAEEASREARPRAYSRRAAAETKAAMYDRIRKHGETLLSMFPDATIKDPVKLCKALRRIETQGHTLAERECNGSLPYDGPGSWETVSGSLVARAVRILGPLAAGVVFGNGDPRGYFLKIEDAAMRVTFHNSTLHRDWGGYGILAPDLTESN